jgi:hypothetical protein
VFSADLAEASDQEIHCGAIETRVVLQHSVALGQDLERVQQFPNVDFRLFTGSPSSSPPLLDEESSSP